MQEIIHLDILCTVLLVVFCASWLCVGRIQTRPEVAKYLHRSEKLGMWFVAICATAGLFAVLLKLN